jgi:RasGEF N-terminal motif
VQPFRRPNPTHFSTLEVIPEDGPVSSSAPSQGGESSPENVWSTTLSRSIPSPLLHGSKNDDLDELLSSPLIQEPSTSSHLYSPLLLDPIDLTSLRLPSSAARLDRPISPSSSIYSRPDTLLTSISSGTHLTSISSSHLTSISSNSHLKSISSGTHLTGINSGTHLTSISSSTFPTSNFADTPPTSTPTITLLDAAVRDTECALRRSADGTVEAGTLGGLVDHLLKVTHDPVKDDEVTRVFFATYRLFITDENLFRVLKRRFEEIGVSDTPNLSTPLGSIPDKCVLCMRYNVGLLTHRPSTLLFLRTWLCEDGENMDHELLISIKQFATSVDGSEAKNAVAQYIVELVDEKVCAEAHASSG